MADVVRLDPDAAVGDLFTDPVTGEEYDRVTGFPRFISAYSPKLFVGVDFVRPSRTKQSHRDETDINNIMASWQKTGYDAFEERRGKGMFTDVSNVSDYQDSLNTVMAAQAAFADLPAELRRTFDNDPAEFLAFCENASREEFERVGLVPPAERPLPKSGAPDASGAVKGTQEPPEGDKSA